MTKFSTNPKIKIRSAYNFIVSKYVKKFFNCFIYTCFCDKFLINFLRKTNVLLILDT